MQDSKATKDVESGQYDHGTLTQPAHTLVISKLIQELSANAQDGLSTADAETRLNQHGTNELNDGEKINFGSILLRQIANAMTLVLLIAMAVSFAIRSYIEGAVLGLIILVNTGLGFWVEFKAEKTMNSLRSLSSPTANVVRDGSTVCIPTKLVVPGDMVELNTGDTIPADLRLVEAVNFECDESLLTGESIPVEKNAEAIFEENTGPGDRLNIAYSSSVVTKGRARGIVFATGMTTEIGSIAAALRSKRLKKREVKRNEDGSAGPHRYAQAYYLTALDVLGAFLGVNIGTPLQRKLSKLALYLFGIALVCALIVVAANNFVKFPAYPDSDPKQEIAIYAVATGVSMIPACLIVVLTITMAAGTKVMSRRHVIVRKLNALEALGGVTDICSDKTGTLTQGQMVAKATWIPSLGTYLVTETNEPTNPTEGSILFSPLAPTHGGLQGEKAKSQSPDDFLHDNCSLKEFLKVAAFANLATVHQTAGQWKARGSPTEVAIQVFSSRLGWNRDQAMSGENDSWREMAEFPFDSDVKMMSVIFQEPHSGGKHVFTKGAVERVLDSCSHICDDKGMVRLTNEMRRKIHDCMQAISSNGLRCLALASKNWTGDIENGTDIKRRVVESGLTFRGLIGLYDPPRPESRGAVQKCHQAGINVRMLTGDHVETARAIARQVGIIPERTLHLSKDSADTMVMTADEFDDLSDDQIDQLPSPPLVIARCTPRTKVRLIEALHRRERFVSMTGDGVNDSPSLKYADVGIAMGKTGSDVAKDASDIILTDDNFASISNAIEEGRRMFDNIQKFVLHVLSENVAQAIVLLVGLAFKDGRGISIFPLSPVEIMWLIMITSGFPDMGLGREKAAHNIMRRPPVQLKTGIFDWMIVADMIVYGIWIAILCLASFAFVIWGIGDGNLGNNCNKGYSDECDLVFKARGTTFACLTCFSVFLAMELKDMRRSLFQGRPGSYWYREIFDNKILIWSVFGGMVLLFPILYVPVINTDVFVHKAHPMTWPIVVVSSILFFAGVEGWKWATRFMIRHLGRLNRNDEQRDPDSSTSRVAAGNSNVEKV